MKEYHVVFEGVNGFQKEETMTFEEHNIPWTLYRREFAQITLTAQSFMPLGNMVESKDRCFRKIAGFYCCGRNILYYREERC